MHKKIILMFALVVCIAIMALGYLNEDKVLVHKLSVLFGLLGGIEVAGIFFKDPFKSPLLFAIGIITALVFFFLFHFGQFRIGCGLSVILVSVMAFAQFSDLADDWAERKEKNRH